MVLFVQLIPQGIDLRAAIRSVHESVVISVAYKGSGKKAKIQGSGQRRSQYSLTNSYANLGAPKKSKKQTSRTHHDTLKGNKGNGGGKSRFR